MAGFANDIVYANNGDFSIAGSNKGSLANGLITDGQLWIGSTALNVGGTHVNVGNLTSPDSSVAIGFSAPNITLSAGTAAGTLKTLTPTENFNGTAATPISGTAGNINAFGANPSFVTVTETLNSTALATGNLQVEHRAWLTGLVVDPSTTPGTRGTFSTIGTALTAAVSGQTIFIRTGIYTEDLTLKPGVNLASFSNSGDTPNVTIIGNSTLSTAGTVTITDMRLQTNSAAFLTVSGSAASIVNVDNCFLNCVNATGISYSSSSTSSQVNVMNCTGNIATTGITLFANSSTGPLTLKSCLINNSGNSVTPSTSTSAHTFIRSSTLAFPISTTAPGVVTIQFSFIDTNALNVPCLTTSGSATNSCYHSIFFSGSSASLSIGTTNTLITHNITVNNTATNAITGSGTLEKGLISFVSSNLINPTATVLSVIDAGQYRGRYVGTAPSAGMIGEQIRSVVASGAAVPLSSSTATNITSISLTPGIWDVSCVADFTGFTVGTQISASISTVSATQGTSGDNQVSFPITAIGAMFSSLVIPSYRISLTTTTTVFLVGVAVFTIGTSSGFGRISATRVA